MKKLEWTTKKVMVKELIKLEFNPRKITEEKRKKLIESLEKFNLVEIPAVNTDMKIIGGNQRVTALLLAGRGEEEIDVRYPNRKLTDKEVKEYCIISNTHAGEFDFDMLEMDFADINLDDIGFDLAGLDAWELAKEKEAKKLEAKEDDYDVPDGGLETDIVLGDLFEIGEHRLLCGDSTNSDDVAKLLLKNEPYLMITDPPYGVVYDPNWRNEAHRANGKKIGAWAVGKVQNDDKADWSEAWILSPAKVAYVYHAGKFSGLVQKSLENCDFEIRSQIIWAKNNFAISRGDYHWKHEPCWYAVKKGFKANYIGDRSQTTLWEIAKPQKSETGHGTQKPVECMAKPIKNHEGDIHDPFGGSGTTMVASEQLKRKAYLMELDPKYCQVIIDRMLRLDNTLVIKRNGELWNTQKTS